MSPAWCNTSAFGDVERPAPLLWIRGDEDQVVGDQSMFDFGTLGQLGRFPIGRGSTFSRRNHR